MAKIAKIKGPSTTVSKRPTDKFLKVLRSLQK